MEKIFFHIYGRPSLFSPKLPIARYSPILNQSTGLSNEGFTWSFTHRITGSLSVLFHTNGSIHGAGLTTCPATKRNGDPCGRLYACYRDALRIELTKVWAHGIVHPESKHSLAYFRLRHSPFEAMEVNQLDKDITEFGRSAAGATLTRPVLTCA